MALTDAMPAKRNPGGRRGDDADFPPDIPRTKDKHARPRILELDPLTGRLPIARKTGEPIRKLVAYSRASALGNLVEDQHGLGIWRAAVALWGAFRAYGDTIRIAVQAIRGYDNKADKQALYGLVERCQQIADIDHAADHGTALHAIFDQHDQGLDLPYLGQDQPALDAYAGAIGRFEVVAGEQFVVVDEVDGLWIRAAGTFDRLVTPRRPTAIVDRHGEVLGVVLPGELIVVDVKTGSTADWFGVKFRLQLWLYAHGRRYNPQTGERRDIPGVRRDFALILHVPAGGNSATWHWVDLRGGIELARTALAVREHRNLGKRSIWPADLDAPVPEGSRVVDGQAEPAEPVVVLPDGTRRQRELAALSAEVSACVDRYGLGQVWERWQGVWDEDMQQVVERRMAVLGIPVRTDRRRVAS